MKKRVLFLMVTALVLVAGFTACGANTSSDYDSQDEKTDEEAIREAAKHDIDYYYVFAYDDFTFVNATTVTVEKIKDDEYKVYGRISANDKYGNTFKNEFTVIVYKFYTDEENGVYEWHARGRELKNKRWVKS